jgi:hypothetical protein
MGVERGISARRLLVIAALVSLAVVSTSAAGERVVAVGDIHGSYDGLVTILQRAGLIDDNAHWIGGKATFVQTGDIFDRGVEVRKILDLLMRLEKEAAAAGGKVIVLIGNHEGMNLIGFYRDVNPEVYATFVDGQSEKRRKAAFKDYKKYVLAKAKQMGVPAPSITSDIKDQWMEIIPPGWIEHNEALPASCRGGDRRRALHSRRHRPGSRRPQPRRDQCQGRRRARHL